MKKSKSKNLKRAFYLVVIVLFLISLMYFSAKTFAKYISKVEGHVGADVAQWNFRVNGEKSVMQNIRLTDSAEPGSLVGGKIAPGSKGTLKFELDPIDTDGIISYSFDFMNETEKPQNLKFYYNNVKYDSLDDLEKVLKGTIEKYEHNICRVILIKWEWEYSADSENVNVQNEHDIQDTKDAMAMQSYSFDVNVIAEQVEDLVKPEP